MHAPWPGWAAKVVVSPDAARWPSDTTWKLGRVQTGGSVSQFIKFLFCFIDLYVYIFASTILSLLYQVFLSGK